jgi:hypothetical protein
MLWFCRVTVANETEAVVLKQTTVVFALCSRNNFVALFREKMTSRIGRNGHTNKNERLLLVARFEKFGYAL